MAVSSALLDFESHTALLAEQATQAATRLAQWHTYPSAMAKFQSSTASHPSHRSQSSSSSETTLTPYLDDLVKHLDMSQTLIGNALALAPEGDEGAGVPATPERSTTPGSAAHGAGGAGADPHEGAIATSPFARLSDVFTIGSSPTASESSTETTLFLSRSSSPGPAGGSMRSLTATIARDYGTNPPVANHSTESDITNSNEGSEVDLGSSGSDNSEAPSHTEIILFVVVWTIAAIAVTIAAVAVVAAFTATVRMQRKQNGSSVTAILSEKRVGHISALWSEGKLTISSNSWRCWHGSVALVHVVP
jgi:hypothetical protein